MFARLLGGLRWLVTHGPCRMWILLVGIVPALTFSASQSATAQIHVGPAMPIWEDSLLNYEAAVAYNVLHDEFLVVWSTEQDSFTVDIAAQRVARDGTMLSGFVVHSIPGIWLLGPSVAYSPEQDEYLVTWLDTGGVDYDIYGRRISSAGAVLHPVFPIATGAGFQFGPKVAYAGSVDEYLVVYWNMWTGGGSDIAAQRVNASDNGLLSWANVATGGEERSGPAVAYNEYSNQYLISYLVEPTAGADRAIVGKIAATDLNGISVAPEQLFVPANGSTGMVAAAAGSDGYALAFHRDSTVRAQSLGLDGSPTGAAHGSQISQAPISTDPVGLDLVHVWGQEYIAVWDTAASLDTSQIMGAQLFVQPGGPFAAEFPVETRPHDQYWPALACAPYGRCLVAYSDDWNAGVAYDTDIWGHFIDIPFFADGFEEGNLDHWSEVFP